MITEIIVFDIPDDMTRDEVMANYRWSAPAWRTNPGFIRKITSTMLKRACGVYL